MRIDRLMGIIVYLINNGRTSAQKLAEKFEVSPRTIMRDLEALDQARIPIQSFFGADGGYKIMDSYVMDRQVTTIDEYEWIVAALKGMTTAYSNQILEQTLAKTIIMYPICNNRVSIDLGAANEDRGINEQLKFGTVLFSRLAI